MLRRAALPAPTWPLPLTRWPLVSRAPRWPWPRHPGAGARRRWSLELAAAARSSGKSRVFGRVGTGNRGSR
uniref:Uncharacterized protein n=1 Tax=Arundo donax TaxID=35708 RepID=A0A0A9GQE4_ARUDO